MYTDGGIGSLTEATTCMLQVWGSKTLWLLKNWPKHRRCNLIFKLQWLVKHRSVIYCWQHLAALPKEPQWGTSNENPLCMFLWRTGENYSSNIIKYLTTLLTMQPVFFSASKTSEIHAKLTTIFKFIWKILLKINKPQVFIKVFFLFFILIFVLFLFWFLIFQWLHSWSGTCTTLLDYFWFKLWFIRHINKRWSQLRLLLPLFCFLFRHLLAQYLCFWSATCAILLDYLWFGFRPIRINKRWSQLRLLMLLLLLLFLFPYHSLPHLIFGWFCSWSGTCTMLPDYLWFRFRPIRHSNKRWCQLRLLRSLLCFELSRPLLTNLIFGFCSVRCAGSLPRLQKHAAKIYHFSPWRTASGMIWCCGLKLAFSSWWIQTTVFTFSLHFIFLVLRRS